MLTALLVPIAALAIAIPFCVPAEHVVARTAAGYWAVAVVLRVVDLARSPASFRPGERVKALLFLVDPRRLPRHAPRFEAGLFASALPLGAVSVAMLVLAHRLGAGEPPFGSPALYARSIAGGLALLAGAESSDRMVRAVAAAIGRGIPRLHVAPARSLSLSELWGQRWNRWVGDWLREHAYRPLARRGQARLGVVAAFAGSALVHVYPTYVALGVMPALTIGAFFLAQGVLVIAEARARVRRWPRSLRRVHVIACFAVTLPLFSEPFLRSLGL